MRSALHRLFLLVALVLGVASASTHAYADDRAEAKIHYQAGVKAYNGADYRAAIKEFSAAQQLAPADLNNYNLALCYDKLGEADSAMNYYKVYLERVPTTDKRGEIEASVARLDAAAKSATAKKAAEAKAVEDAKAAEVARKAEEMKRAEADARKAEDARRAEDEARRAEAEAKQHPVPVGPVSGPPVSSTGGSTGTVSSGVGVTTGDAQLDRAQSIDINAIRDQRMGAGSSGMPDTRGGPAIAPATGNQTPPANLQGRQPPPLAGGMQAQNGQQPIDQQPKKADPIYKKWWFWAVVAVTAYVVYEIAASNPTNSSTAREQPLHGVSQASRPSGLTLLSW